MGTPERKGLRIVSKIFTREWTEPPGCERDEEEKAAGPKAST